jgi:hypothetical protein
MIRAFLYTVTGRVSQGGAMKEQDGSGLGLRATTLISLAGAVLGLVCYLAGTGDAYYHFTDQTGTEQVVLATRFLDNLPWAVPAAILAVVSVWLPCGWAAWRFFGISAAEALCVDAETLLPISLLLLTPLRYFPGIANFSSVLFLIAGKMSTALFILAVILAAALKIIAFQPHAKPKGRDDGREHGFSHGAVGWFIFGFLAVLYAVWTPLFSAGWAIAGDEVHYLVVTHSLLEDGDILIEDDFEDGVYTKFSAWRNLEPYHIRLSARGEIVPFHRIGMPLLAVPFYALAGKTGAVFLVGLMAALAAANIYWLVSRYLGSRLWSLAATSWVVFSMPNFGLSFLFFSETPQALVVSMSANLIFRGKNPRPKLLWLIPPLIWTLPWFHAKGFMTAAGLSLLLLWRLRRERRRLVVAAMLCLFLAAAIPAWNLYLYGEFSPIAETDQKHRENLSVLNVPNGLGGILFDQEFGLLLWNPAVVFALVGLVPLWRRERELTAAVVIVAAFTVGPATIYHMWWGGDSVPARYVAPAMPLAALPLAALLWCERFRRWRPAALIIAAVSVSIGIALVANLMPSDARDGVSHKLAALSVGRYDVVELWPAWFGDAFWLRVGLLLFGAGAATVATILAAKLTARSAGEGVAATVSVVVLIAAAVSYGWAAEGLTPGEPTAGRQYDRAFDLEYQRLWRRGEVPLLDVRGTLKSDSLPNRGFSAVRLFAPEELRRDEDSPGGRARFFPAGSHEVLLQDTDPLWAGEYDLLLRVRGAGGAGTVGVSVFDVSEARFEEPRPEAQAEFDVGRGYGDYALPAGLPVNSLGLRLRLECRKGIVFSSAVLVPRRVVRQGEWEYPAEEFERPAAMFDGFTLFLDMRSVFPPEGRWMWTQGNVESLWCVVCERPFETLRFQLVGRAPVRIGIDGKIVVFGGKEQVGEVTLAAGGRPVGNYWTAEFRVAVEGHFVPAEVIEGSRDRRELGVRVRLRPVQ